MALHIVCPGCRAAFVAPDAARGKQVRCKKCSKVFVAAAAPAPPAGAEAPTAPPRQRGSKTPLVLGAAVVLLAGIGVALWLAFGKGTAPQQEAQAGAAAAPVEPPSSPAAPTGALAPQSTEKTGPREEPKPADDPKAKEDNAKPLEEPKAKVADEPKAKPVEDPKPKLPDKMVAVADAPRDKPPVNVVPGSKPLPVRPGELGSIEGKTGEETRSMVVSPDGHWGLTWGQSPSVRIWDLERGQIVKELTAAKSVIRGVACLADNKRAVVLRQQGGVLKPEADMQLIELSTGKTLFHFDKPSPGTLNLTLSGDGKRLATVGSPVGKQSGEIRIWDPETGKELMRSDEIPIWPAGPSTSTDGSRVVCSMQGKLMFWDAAHGPKIREVGPKTGDILSTARLTPDGKRLLIAYYVSPLIVWDIDADKEEFRIEMPSPIRILSTASDSRQVAAGCIASSYLDKTGGATYVGASLVLIDLEKRTTRVSLRAERGLIGGLALLGDGRVISSSTERKIRVWDPTRWPSPEEARAILPPAFPPVAVPPVPQDSPLDALRRAMIAGHELDIEGEGDRTKAAPQLVAVLGDSKLLQPYVNRKPASTSPRGHTRPVYGLAFSPDGKRLASCSDDRTIILWDCTTGKPLRQITKQAAYLNGVAFSPDGMRLVSTAQETTAKSGQSVMLWDAGSGQELADIAGIGQAHSGSFSPDSKWLAWCGTHSVRVWDAAGRRQLLNLDGYGAEFFSLVFSPDGTRLAGGGGNAVFVWDLTNGEELHVISGHRARNISSVAFSPDGQLLASADTGRAMRQGSKFTAPPEKPTSVKIWNANTGKEVRSFNDGFENGAYSVAFSPDGKRLATAGPRQPVRVWDVASGKELLSIGFAKRVDHVVRFSPDGRYLAVGDERGVVCIYRLEEKP